MKRQFSFACLILLIAIAIAVPSDLFAGKHTNKVSGRLAFSITGNIRNMPAQTITLEQLTANDSLFIVDSQRSDAAGHFEFKGSIPEPGLYRLHFKPDKFILLSLDNGNIKITANWPILDFKIEGSLPSVQLKSFIDTANAYMLVTRKSKAYRDSVKNTGAESLLPEAEKSFTENNATFTNYLKHYSYTTPYQPNAILAARSFNPNDEPAYLDAFARSQEERFPGTDMTKDFLRYLHKAKESMPEPDEIGDKAPELSLIDTSGKPVTLSSLRGKYVLLDFWASWCGPCRAENPNVRAAYEKYKNKNFTILAVSLDSKRENWINAIEHDKLEWQQVSDLKGWQSQAAGKYSVRSIPTNFLIDPKGMIIARSLRGPQLEDKLEEVLK